MLLPPVLLASGSPTRLAMLRATGFEVEALPPRVDEVALRAALCAEGAGPRDVADALAETKALKISARHAERLVLGADQVLALGARILGKPESPADLAEQLRDLAGREHRLLSALVVCQGGAPLWRHVGEARLTMRPLREAEIAAYVAENFETVRGCAGGYQIEGRGVQLFSKVEGSHFTILGLPLVEFLTWLAARSEAAA